MLKVCSNSESSTVIVYFTKHRHWSFDLPVLVLAQNQIQLFTHQGSCQSCNCWAALGFLVRFLPALLQVQKKTDNTPSLSVCPSDIAILVQWCYNVTILILRHYIVLIDLLITGCVWHDRSPISACLSFWLQPTSLTSVDDQQATMVGVNNYLVMGVVAL